MFNFIKDPIFLAALTAFGTICAALGAIFGIWIARGQLREVARSTGTAAVFSLYALFDDKKNREYRKKIWKEISHIKPDNLTDKDWDVIERTATSMDVVGTMLKHDLVKRELIFERYTEVIVPLWEAMKPHIQYRRIKKGKYGWNNFEWLTKVCREWSLSNRGTDTYQRF